jgi:hypothetical protein
MLTMKMRMARRIAGLAGIVCAALLATACNAQTSPNVVVTDAPNPSVAYLAQGQDLHGKLLFEPACNGFGCALSGDSTVFLSKMKWTTWSETEAVGTGIDKIDGCNPDCAAGPVYSVPTVVTLSNPVKACFGSDAPHMVWTRASFRFPHGLPKALQGSNAPLNPWVFSALKSEAKHSCAS